MEYKRLLCLLLAVVMILTTLSGCGDNKAEYSNPTQETSAIEKQSELINNLDIPDLWKQELHHAIQLGIPMDKIQQETISGKEMMELLDWLVNYAVAEKSDSWKEKFLTIRESNAQLSRFDAMTALFLAAEHIGGVYVGHNYGIMEMAEGIKHSWDADYVTWKLFGGFEAHGQYSCGAFGEGYLDGAAYYFNLGRASYFSGEYPFPLDTDINSFAFDLPPSYADAVLAVVRLISSTDADLFASEPTETETEYLNIAKEKREQIHASAADITDTISGTIYYVSNNGSDKNDGLSPETAWATPQYALSKQLRPGDALLLNRGDSWIIKASDKFGLTSSALIVPEGVVLGAYGTGEKPLLEGALEDANSSEFWELYYEQDGVKIWRAAQSTYYCPIIVFNNGDDWASPLMPRMDANGQYLSKDGTVFNVANEFTKDLQFASLLDMTQYGANTDIENSAVKGELYLRCDKGNPAEVFEDVALPQAASGLVLGTNASICDIALRYFTCNGALMDGYDGFHSQSVLNCEVGWCGGLLKGYVENHLGIFEPSAAGGALQISSTNITITGNHIHHCGPFGLIIAIHNNADNPSSCILHFEDIYIANNLMEYCGSGIHMGDYADGDIPGTKGYITNLVFEDNLLTYSGHGWVREMVWQESGGSSASLSAFETNDSAIDNDGIYIRNNTFYKSAFALFSLSEYHLDRSTPVNALPVFSGNTYIQYANKAILQKNRSTELYYPSEDTVKSVLGDQSGSLVIVER